MSLYNIVRGHQPVSTFLSMVAHGESLDSGNAGEYLCAYAIEHSGLSPATHPYRNLVVPTGPRSKLETTEIDVVMLHPTGIYVIESKNYSGWVFGRADQCNWTVCLNRNTKERVPNPIRQNEGHIAALMRLLDLPRDAFVSLVVFSERCELKRVPDDTDDVLVLHRDRLVGRGRRLIGRRDARFDAAQVESIAHALDVLAEESSVEERRRHAERVKEEMPHQ